MTSRTVIEETTEGQAVYNAITDPTRTCVKCGHFEVCTVHRSAWRQLSFDYPNVAKEALPFDVNNLAKICQYYKRANVGEDV